MTGRDWIEIVLLLLLIANLGVLSSAMILTLKRLTGLSIRLDSAMEEIQRDTVRTLQETHTALTQMGAALSTLDNLLQSEVTPTLQTARSALTHVDVTLKGVADATTSVRRIAAGAEALTGPSVISAAIERTAGSGPGRVALLAAGALALFQGVLTRRGRRSAKTTKGEGHGESG